MEFVQPIRSKETIKDIKSYYEKKSERNYALFCTGIYIPLRMSDLLKLKVRDVRGKDYVLIRETKTGKPFKIEINVELKKVLYKYTANKKEYEYLFVSRQGKNKPICRQRAYDILKEVADEFGLEGIGCHTLRKTFGYHFYKKYQNIEMLVEIFNHSDRKVSSRYIGLEEDTINQAIRKFNYD